MFLVKINKPVQLSFDKVSCIEGNVDENQQEKSFVQLESGAKVKRLEHCQTQHSPEELTVQEKNRNEGDENDLSSRDMTNGLFQSLEQRLPPAITSYLVELSLSLNVPLNLATTYMLGLLACIYQSRYVISLKGWEEPLSLYLMTISPHNCRESLMLSRLMEPFYAYQYERQTQEEHGIREIKAQHRLLKKSVNLLENKAARESPKQERYKKEYLSMLTKLEEMEIPHKHKMLAGYQNIAELLKDVRVQREGMTCVAPASILLQFQRRDALEHLNTCVLLNDGVLPICGSQHFGVMGQPKQRLSLILTADPDVVPILKFSTGQIQELCSRFLLAVSTADDGFRWSNLSAVNEKTMDEYNYFVRAALNTSKRGKLRISRLGMKEIQKYAENIEHMRCDEPSKAVVPSARFSSHALRIAGLLHCASKGDDASKSEIDRNTVISAVKITEYYRYQIMVAHGRATEIRSTSDVKHVLLALAEVPDRLPHITVRNLNEKTKEKIGGVQRLKNALAKLEEDNVVSLKKMGKSRLVTIDYEALNNMLEKE